jgi:NAD-dependent deacetylase
MLDIADQLASLLRTARHVLVFTGAGVSTRSGIPDYRGPQGTWTRRQPTTYQSFMSSDAARREYWDYKLESWDAWRDAEPNATHVAGVELERAGRLEMLVTQNVDGLHSKAGTTDERLVELHGTNNAVECQSCGERSEPAAHFESFRATGVPPLCACGGFLKPATISFGQSLRHEDLERAQRAALACDLVVALGSTLSVYPAAGIPLIAANNGAPYAIINSGETDHDGMREVTLRIEGDVSEIFPAAVRVALNDDETR